MEHTVRDVSIYYETYGSGRPILMIHGWGPDHRLMKGCMEPIFQSNGAQWKRIYFDLPGMGRTKGQPWITGSDKMLDVILEFMDGICPNEPFLIAGESYGGYLARGLVRQRPSAVDGLLLLCPLAVPETQEANSPTLKVLEKDDSLLRTLSEQDRLQFQAINVLQNKRVWERFRNEVLAGLNVADKSFLEKCLGQNVSFGRSIDTLEQPYTKPTLIVMGRQDSAVGYRDSWGMVEHFPRASFVILDKAGHNLQIEQDVLFNELVKEWLNRVVEHIE